MKSRFKDHCGLFYRALIMLFIKETAIHRMAVHKYSLIFEQVLLVKCQFPYMILRRRRCIYIQLFHMQYLHR